MKLTHEYLMELASIDQKIGYTKALLAASKFKSISITFFTERSNGEPDFFHSLRQENFDFSLSYELVKILNEHLDFLEFKKETLLNNKEQFCDSNDLKTTFTNYLNNKLNEQ